MKKWIVETENLTKTYQAGDIAVTALAGVDLRVAAGEFVAIIGKSGSGKSTLLHMLGGLDVPSTGRVVVDGNDVAAMDRTELALFRRRRVGFIFQQYNLIPELCVWDNVVFPLALDGTPIDEAFVGDVLAALHSDGKRPMMPSQLSGGEQQRVAIARALAMQPALILADEPTGNLDTLTSHEVMGLIRTLAAKLHQTLIVVTHDIDIAQLADRIVEMRDGQIVRGGATDACE